MDEWMDADFGTDFGGELYRQHLEGTVLYRQKRQFKKEEDPSQLTARQNQSLQQYGLKMEEGRRKTGSKKKKKKNMTQAPMLANGYLRRVAIYT